MTPDGQWIVASERSYQSCAFQLERIVMVRADGTSHRVLVDYPEVWALKPDTVDDIWFLRISGDGALAYFSMPALHSTGIGCSWGPPGGQYLLDTATGSVVDLAPDGLVAGEPSWTDNGRQMAFKAINPATGTAWFYLGGPDGSGAVPFLDASGWLFSSGLVSGDGSHFLVLAEHNHVSPILGDVFVYDLRAGTLTKVTPAPVPDVRTANFSGDGSRVVYDDGPGTVYAVNGDGTDHRVLSPFVVNESFSMRPTISRSGEYVFLWKHPKPVRVSWDGLVIQDVVGGFNMIFGGGPFNIAPAAIDKDGGRCAFWADDYGGFPILGPHDPLCTWFEQTPVLATYGTGLPGSTLTCEVGGPQQSPFLVSWSPLPARIPLAGLGILGLSPHHTSPLAVGSVTSVTNTGKLPLPLPADLGAVAGATVYFQALFQDAVSGALSLTNTTAFTFPAPGSSAPAELPAIAREPGERPGRAAPIRLPDDPWLARSLLDPTLQYLPRR